MNPAARYRRGLLLTTEPSSLITYARRNKTHQILTDLVLFTWLGRRDSNPRMPVPKTGALPLGDALLSRVAIILKISWIG